MDGNAGGTHALATGVKPRCNGQGRGGGARWDLGGRGNARGKRDGKGHCIIITSRRSINGSHGSSSISHSSNRSDHQDTLAGGDHHMFVSVATSQDISMQNVQRYFPRR